MMTRHALKCWPEFFQAIADGRKSFEIRVNDRNYQVGDILVLCEWNPELAIYTGRKLVRRNSYQVALTAVRGVDAVVMALVEVTS
jgi:hypothetical protein